MERPRRAEYTPLDFSQWQAGNSLSLSPKFQRRGVWKPAARSFFVDSLLKGMPVPPNLSARNPIRKERSRHSGGNRWSTTNHVCLGIYGRLGP